MRTQATADVEHLQERLNRLENELKKIARVVGPLNQQAQITSAMPTQAAGYCLYAYLPSGQTLPAGTSNGMVMGSNGNVVLCTNSGGSLTAGSTTISVNNIAGTITGPKALILLPMADGTYSCGVAPC